MIKTVTMYSVVCDRCGKHYCPDCYEFDDELDEYVPKKKGD